MPLPSPIAAWFESWFLGIPEIVALALVTMIGYLFVLRKRQPTKDPLRELAEMEVQRAGSIARELEKIAAAVRKDLAANRRDIVRFKSKLSALPTRNANGSQPLYEQAERILAPTLKLAAQLSHAYEELNQLLSDLLKIDECRTDPVTGVGNRRALDEHLTVLFGTLTRQDRPFTIAIFGVDQFEEIHERRGAKAGEQVLREVASLFKQTVRETDFVARSGGEEFVVVMPKTRLFGGSVFGERLRSLVEEKLNVTVSGGTAEATARDSTQTLMARADSALYSAKAAGRNAVFQHNGSMIRQVERQSGSDRKTEAVAAVGR